MKEKTQQLGKIIAHWNLEHSSKERKAHLDWANGFLKEAGLEKYMTAQLKNPIGSWTLGWPKTVVDLKLRKKYCGKIYRHMRTKGRVAGLSVIHLTFARQAGVFDFNRAMNEVHLMTDKCEGAKDAARISAWKGWDGTVCEYCLCTDAKYYEYRSRNCSGYSGGWDNSFKYGPDWDDVHRRLGDVLYRIVDDLGLRRVRG